MKFGWIGVFALIAIGCNGDTPALDEHGHSADAHGKADKPAVPPLTELKTEDVEEGSGPAAAKGDTLVMKYTGKFADGSVFDSNDKPDGQPFTLTLGAGQVIRGWDEGLVGMKAGGKRKLSIPWEKAYGEQGSGKIPPQTDLFFDVELLDLIKEGEDMVVGVQDIKPGTGREVKTGDTLVIDYKLSLPGGKVVEEQKNLEFPMGKGKMIEGVEAGLKGMKEGGVRKLKLPPLMAFGPVGNSLVPPNSIVYFEITLKDVK